MKAYFTPVDEQNLPVLAELANEIWHEFFTIILSAEQIDYMVDKFQSYHAMKDQMKNQGYYYYLIQQEGKNLGYFAVRYDEEKVFLSKLYLHKSARGKGISSLAFEMIEKLTRDAGKKSIWLTVNKYNDHTIEVYKHRGFKTIRAEATDIGQGYVMDDYIMEKELDS